MAFDRRGALLLTGGAALGASVHPGLDLGTAHRAGHLAGDGGWRGGTGGGRRRSGRRTSPSCSARKETTSASLVSYSASRGAGINQTWTCTTVHPLTRRTAVNASANAIGRIKIALTVLSLGRHTQQIGAASRLGVKGAAWRRHRHEALECGSRQSQKILPAWPW